MQPPKSSPRVSVYLPCLVCVRAVCSCRPYTLPDGASNGQPVVTYEGGVDWGNGFVGQYDLADVQYKNFTAINNNIGMYWKGSRSMRSVGAAHIKVGFAGTACAI